MLGSSDNIIRLKTQHVVRILYLVRILYIPNPQSLVRIPQSGRSPQFAADLKRSTRLCCVRNAARLQQKHTYQ